MKRISRRTAAFTAGAILWILLPILVVAAALHHDAGQSFAPPTPVWVAATHDTEPVTNDVQIALLWGLPNNLVAPSWTGTVQTVRISPGDTVTDADPITIIDGITRLAAATHRPFYRPLTTGDTGNDVAALNAWLAANGYDHAAGDDFTAATRSGVTVLARNIGAPTDNGFDPAWFIYLPANKITLTGVTLVPATPAPSAGTAIATATPALANAALVHPLTVTTDATSGGAPDAATLTDADKVIADASQTLTVNGQVIPLSKSRDTVAKAALPDLAAAIPAGTPAIDAILSSPALNAVVIPASAVFTDAHAATCVVSDEKNPHGVKVTLAGTRGDQAVIDEGLAAGTRVLIAPPASERSCP